MVASAETGGRRPQQPASDVASHSNWRKLWVTPQLGPGTLLAQANRFEGLPDQGLDPETRARVFSALAGLAGLGLVAVLAIWLAGVAIRRYTYRSQRPGRQRLGTHWHEDDWASRPLAPPDEAPPGKRSE